MYSENSIILSSCASISEARFTPILAKYKLHVFAISLELDKIRQFCIKIEGKSLFLVSTQGFIDSTSS